MRVTVKYFASLREALGASDVVDVAEGATVATLRDTLLARGGAHAERLSRDRAVRCAVNQTLADEDTPLKAQAEVAFFPPVTGG
jgi:sulfur-carrier protein